MFFVEDVYLKKMLEKYIIKLSIIISLIILTPIRSKAEVRLPVLISEGMVLQRDCPIKIWGWANPEEKINVTFHGKKYSTSADNDGNWMLVMDSEQAGGPYTMFINNLKLNNILIGDVWLCAGQSNMETTISRIYERFANEIDTYENNQIRHIKLQHDYTLDGAKKDVKSAHWYPANKDYVSSMTAVPYFFAKFLYQKEKVPIGLVNVAVGGSVAEAWVDENYLGQYKHYLIDKEIAKAEGYVQASQDIQKLRADLYQKYLEENDRGLAENWKDILLDDSLWDEVDLFDNWGSDGLNSINGVHWLRRDVNLSKDMLEQKGVLRLGCIVESDSVFINGSFIGATGYQYPPRIYQIPDTLLKEGKNNITIRLFCPNGRPRFVEGKSYKIEVNGRDIDLLGKWKHQVGCRMLPLPNGDNFSAKAGVIYDALIAPIKDLNFKGVLWYQGESNTDRFNEYYGIMSALIKNWRDLFNAPNLPFIIAQLPNFMNQKNSPSDGQWAQLRDIQLQLSHDIPNVGLSVNVDLGEYNDIHPLNKKDVGYRLMLQSEKLVYGNDNIIADGPIFESSRIEGNKIRLFFKSGTNDFMPVDHLVGFAIAGHDGKYKWANAEINNGEIVVWNDTVAEPLNVRYAWADNPGNVNLKNKSGLPASPFQTKNK